MLARATQETTHDRPSEGPHEGLRDGLHAPDPQRERSGKHCAVRTGRQAQCAPGVARRKDRLRRVVASYAFCHLVVDFACIATMMGAVSTRIALQGAQQRALAILAYDMLAFCLQLPCGALLDVLGRQRMRAAALVSFALVAAGVLASQTGALLLVPAAVLLAAVGNALFHCAGGIEVLGESAGKAAPSGEFISTGALGVFLGSLPVVCGWPHIALPLLVLLGACAALVLAAPASHECGGLAFHLTAKAWVAVALLAATVALRSYTGMVMAFPWKAELALAACAIACVVVGKAAGGWVADRWGAPLASLASLGGAALLFPFSWHSPVAGLAATLLFNGTMAITLSMLAQLFAQAQGLAFGIASFSLAMGALPALLGIRASSGRVLCVLSLVSLALLEPALALIGRERQRARRQHRAASALAGEGLRRARWHRP